MSGEFSVCFRHHSKPTRENIRGKKKKSGNHSEVLTQLNCGGKDRSSHVHGTNYQWVGVMIVKSCHLVCSLAWFYPRTETATAIMPDSQSHSFAARWPIKRRPNLQPHSSQSNCAGMKGWQNLILNLQDHQDDVST